MAAAQLDIVIKAVDDASKTIQSIEGHIKAAGKAMTVAGGAIVAGLGLAVKSAADAQVEMQKVDTILKAMGGTASQARGTIEQAANATLKLGFDNEAAAVSITRLFQRTGDLNKSISLNNLAMDLARSRNLDLATASNAVGLVLSGNTRILKQFGIEIDETKSPMEALAELQTKVSGSAKDFTNTFAGQASVLKVQFGELVEDIGTKLIPILTDLLKKITPIIEKIVEWIGEHPKLSGAIVLVVAAIGGLMAVLGPLLLILPALSAAATAFGVVLTFLSANPIVLIIAGIGLLIAAIVFLIANWRILAENTKLIWDGIVNNILKPAWETIKGLFEGGLNFIKSLWETIWGGIAGFFTNIWEGIKNVVSSAVGFISNTISRVLNEFENLKRTLEAPIKFASSIATKAFKGVAGFLGFADGGIVTKPTLGVIGEGGESEAVIPLSKLGGMGGGTVVININGNVFSDDANRLANQIGDALIRRLNFNMRF